MQEIIHADVFFFVTTVVIIVLGAIIATLLVYAFGILSDLKHITKKLKQGSEEAMEEWQLIRQRLKDESEKGLSFRGVLGSLFGKKKKTTKSK